MKLLRRQWTVQTIRRMYPLNPVLSQEVSRHWTRRGAERVHHWWATQPAAEIWKPIIVHVDEIDQFHSWLAEHSSRADTPSTVSERTS